MPYCTVSLKLLSPTGHKKQQLEDAMDRYASAFECLLRCVRPKIEGHICSKAEIAAQINLYMPKVDPLGVQPFKDALKRDVAKTLYLYTVQKQKGSRKRYPMLQSNDEDLTQLLMRKEPIAPRTLDYWLERYHRQRPLLFCRYSETRNYALLYDKTQDRYYAKLYLFNAEQARQTQPQCQGKLRYLTSDKILKQSRRPYCYQLYPLEIGGWQKQHLLWLQNGTASAKSAELVQRDGKYYLHVRLWIEPRQAQTARATLGVSRGIEHTLCYALCSEQGAVLRTGYLQEEPGEHRERRLSERVLALAKEHKARIVLANLVTRNDSLDTFTAPQMTVRSYNRLAERLRYRTELCGMPPAVLVSARGLFSRCPECGTVSQGNRMNERIFLCISCGHVEQLETVGAVNLAGKLAQYRKEKLTVYYEIEEQQIVFTLPQISFHHCTENGPRAKASCLQAIQTWMDAQKTPKESVQRNIYQKLRHTVPLEDALQFVHK